MRCRSKKRGTRVKDRAKNGGSRRAGRGWGRKEGNLRSFPFPSPLFHFLALVSFLARPKPVFLCSETRPNGNACHAGYQNLDYNAKKMISSNPHQISILLYTNSDQSRQSLYPFSEQNRAKIISLWGDTYLYSNNKGVPPSPLGGHSSFTFMIVGVPTRIDLYNT